MMKMGYNTNHTDSINRFLPIFIVLAQYTVWGISLGLILLLIFSVTDLVRYQTVVIHKWMIIYIFACLFLQVFFHNLTNGVLTILTAFFTLLVLCGKINEKALCKSYKLWGAIMMVGLMYHVVLVYIFKQNVYPLRVLPVGINSADWMRLMDRPVSFFSEPQAYASYMMPFLFLLLRNKDYRWAIAVTLTIFLSNSTQGFFMMMVLWSFHFLYNGKKMKYWGVLIVVFFLSLYFFSPFFEYARGKMTDETASSIRLTRGFEIFDQMTAGEKLIGIGFQNVAEYVYSVKNKFEWGVGNEGDMLGFISGFSGNMVQFGLVGTFFLLLMYYKFWKNYDPHSRAFLLTIFVSSFSQNLVFNAYFIYFFLIYLGINTNHGKRLSFKKHHDKIHII